MFSAKMQGLLNSTCNDHARLEVLSEINDSLNQEDMNSCSIAVNTVTEALSHLKSDKSDGTALNSNHFVCAASVLPTFLSKLFTAMLRHGHVTKSLRDCVMHPIPKPKKDASMSDNYRSIALAPTLSKVFEWCILIKFHGAFATSSLQFGFKPGVSTDLCTGLIKNVTARYCYNGCFLDASKAFDRVDHGLLFKKLLQRDLPPTVVRTLFKWYTDQLVSVSWDKTVSEPFSIANGVRQGRVLSPILFTVYIDDLLHQLEQSGVCCYWGHQFVGAVCYADDLALLAPSPSALRLMLRHTRCFLMLRRHK